MIILSSLACAPRAFDRDLRDQRWVDAARVFQSDSALINDEGALYQAGILYSSPARPTYAPQRAAQLFQRLLDRFPETRYRRDVVDRLAMVNALIASRDSAATRERDIESRIATLTADSHNLRASLDSALAQNDVLHRNTTKLEADLRDRDDQLRALRLELRQLKDVDLKPRPGSARPP
jgi:hypothetical protein